MIRVIRNIEVIILFTVFWIIMNERANWITLTSGIGVSIAVLWLTNLLDHTDYANDLFRSPLVVVRYFLFLIKEVTLAAIAMAKVIISGRAEVLEFHYYSQLTEERKLFLLATAIIMTPGSITVSRRGRDLLIRTIDPDVANAQAGCQHLEDRIAVITR